MIHLDGAEVERSARLCADVTTVLPAALDRARILLAAEALGGASQAFADTLDYIKEREQFGVAIGSFQALQHRAARVFMRVEMARSAVLAAARTGRMCPHAEGRSSQGSAVPLAWHANLAARCRRLRCTCPPAPRWVHRRRVRFDAPRLVVSFARRIGEQRGPTFVRR